MKRIPKMQLRYMQPKSSGKGQHPMLCIVLLFVTLSSCILLLMNVVVTYTILLPLSKLHFVYRSRTPSADVRRSFFAPAVASTFAIGAREVWNNRSAEADLRSKYIKYDDRNRGTNMNTNMYRPEIDLIMSYLRPFDNMLEYGHGQGQGQGTVHVFSHFVQVYVQYNNGLHINIRNAHHNVTSFDRILLLLTDRNGNTNMNETMHFCLGVLPHYMNSNSLIFFHDYFLFQTQLTKNGQVNEYGSHLLNFFQEVASIRPFENYSHGMVILKPRLDLLKLSTDRLLLRSHSSSRSLNSNINNNINSNESHTKWRLGNAADSGFKYYEMARMLSRETTKSRLLIDCVAFPFVFAAFLFIRTLFFLMFHDGDDRMLVLTTGLNANTHKAGRGTMSDERLEHMEGGVGGRSSIGGGVESDVGATMNSRGNVSKKE